MWRAIGTVVGVSLVLLLLGMELRERPQASAQTPAYRVMTLAGSGEDGTADGSAGSAQFNSPVGIVVDGDGTAYVMDGNRVRRVSLNGEVMTIAGGEESGFADGPAASARFDSPRGIALGPDGTLFIADRGNHRIRAISPQGQVTTLAGTGSAGFADGPGERAQFRAPYGVAVGTDGTVYVADALNHRIRRVTPQGNVSTLAGGGDGGEGAGDYADGPASTARFSFPNGIAVDAAGTIYVADTYNARIRAISPQGTVSTVAGSGEDGGADGAAFEAQFSDPTAVAADGAGGLYVVDRSDRVRQVTPSGAVTTLAGSGVRGFADGPAASAQLDQPEGIAVDAAGTVYVADTGNRRIRTVTLLP